MKQTSIGLWTGCALALAASVCHAGGAGGNDLLGIESGTGKLYRISTVNAGVTLIGPTGLANPAALEYGPNGFLYAFTSGDNANLYTLDPGTAAATLIGPLALPFVFEGGLAFSPNGTAYATNGDGAGNPQLLTINLNTGAASVVGTISGAPHDINGLAWRSDGKLIGLDRVTNSLLEINPATAASSFIAAVPSEVGAIGGMTVAGGRGYYNTAGPTASVPGSNSLYSFDLFTGASVLIGAFPAPITGDGFAGLAVPEPATLGLVAIGAALLVRRQR